MLFEILLILLLLICTGLLFLILCNNAVLSVLSSLAVISLRKRELVASLYVCSCYYYCYFKCSVSILCGTIN